MGRPLCCALALCTAAGRSTRCSQPCAAQRSPRLGRHPPGNSNTVVACAAEAQGRWLPRHLPACLSPAGSLPRPT